MVEAYYQLAGKWTRLPRLTCDISGDLCSHDLDWIDEEGVQCLIAGNASGVPVLRVEEGLILELRGIERLVREIADSQDILFTIYPQRHSKGKVNCGRLGRSFVSRLRRGASIIEQNLPHHEVNPYVEVFFKIAEEFRCICHFVNLDALRGSEAEEFVQVMNDFVLKIRNELSSDSFKAVIKRFKKASSKRSSTKVSKNQVVWARCHLPGLAKSTACEVRSASDRPSASETVAWRTAR